MKVDDDSYINLRRLSEYMTIMDKRCHTNCLIGHVLGPNNPVVRPKSVQGFYSVIYLFFFLRSLNFHISEQDYFLKINKSIEFKTRGKSLLELWVTTFLTV